METSRTPAVIIPKEHQGAPKADELDKAITTAAEEIATGKFKPKEPEIPLTIALRAGIGEGGQLTGTRQDFIETDDSLDLSQHPAVVEALARLEKQRDNATNSQEYLEKSQMLWEMNEQSVRRNKWQRQDRWQGKENEEMRHGLILSPFQFIERLEAVIGKGRVFLPYDRSGRVLGSQDAGNPNTGRVALLIHAPQAREGLSTAQNSSILPLLLEKGKLEREFMDIRDVNKKTRQLARIAAIETHIEMIQRENAPDEFKDFAQVGALQWPLSTEWMILNFDEYGVPTTAKYLGWRTALLSMIRLDVITEEEAHKAFPLGTGPAGSWYRQQLFEWRHHHFDMVQ